MEPSKRIVAYDELVPLSKSEVNAVLYKVSEDQWTQIELHKYEATNDEDRNTHNWRQEIQIDEAPNGHHYNFLKLMEEYETMWEGPLIRIKIAKRRIKLAPGQENPCSSPHVEHSLKHENMKNQILTKCMK